MIFYSIMTIITMFLCLVIQEVLDNTDDYREDDWTSSILAVSLVSVIWPATIAFIVLFLVGFSLKKLARIVGNKIRGVCDGEH